MKKLCLILAFTMLLGLMAPVAFAADWYGDANDGDLLYTADFSGSDPRYAFHRAVVTEGLNADGEYECGWNWDSAYFEATVDPEDPHSAFFENTGVEDPSTGKTTTYNSAWGAKVEGLPLGVGYNYTYTFTVTRTSNTPIGLLFDGMYGIYVYANKGRVQKGGNALKNAGGVKHDFVYYSGVSGTNPSIAEPSVQTFAIEAIQTETEALYNIYVQQDNGRWLLLDSGVPENSGTTWTGETVGLYIYDYHVTDVKVSNVQVYKGVSKISAENALIPDEEEPETEDETGEGENETKEKTTYAPPKVVEEGTEAPAANEEKKGGCGSAIGFGGAMFIIASAGSAAVISFRRKKDD